MGDMGLPGAYGAAGAAEALRAIIKDRLQREQQQFENSRLLAGDARENRRLDQNDQFRQDTLAERANAAKQTSADRQIGLANTLGDQLPAGLELPPTDRAVGLMQSGGRGGLLRGNMTLPSTQTGGGMTMPDAGGAPISGTLRSMSSPEALRSYTKLPSEKQNVDATTREDKLADNARQDKSSQAAIDAKIEGLHQAAEHLRMQGEVNAANILLKQAQAAASEKKGSTINLSQGGKSAKAAIEQAGPLTDQVMQMILKEAPDIETNPQKYNNLQAKGTSLMQTLKYKAGFHDDTDPRQQLVSLLQPIQAGQYTRSSRSRQMLDLALKHMADPSQTLLTQYQRAKELKAIMPEMLQGIVRAEQPVDPSNPLGGSYFDPAKQKDEAAQEFDYVPGKGLVPRKQ